MVLLFAGRLLMSVKITRLDLSVVELRKPAKKEEPADLQRERI
jgi:hypothetical protein